MPLYTAEEWKLAHDQFASEQRRLRQQLQALCTEVASRRPITLSWRKDEPAEPYGCILNKRPDKNPGYCDECPVRDVCPYDAKEWSK